MYPPQRQVHIGLQNKPKLILLVESLVPPFFNDRHKFINTDTSFSWRSEVEIIPRGICQVAGIPFATPKKIPPGDLWINPAGVVIEFYPKSDLAWPERCAVCYKSLIQGSICFDEIRVDVPDLPDKYSPMPPLFFRVLYCSDCGARRLIPRKRRPAVQGFHYNGFTVLLDFSIHEFAEEFIRVNSLIP